MFINFPLISLVIWLPIVGGIWVALGNDKLANLKVHALFFSILSFLISICLIINFDTSLSEMQFVERVAWIPVFGIEYFVGLDGISLPLIVLTTFSTILVIVAGWEVITDRIG